MSNGKDNIWGKLQPETTTEIDENTGLPSEEKKVEAPKVDIWSKLDPEIKGHSEQFKKRQAVPKTVEAKQFDPTQYEDYISNPRAGDETMRTRQALAQPWTDQAINGTKQFGAGLVGGFAMSLGTTLDVEQSIKTVAGVEDEYNNALYEFGTELIESTQKGAPIHQLKPGEVNPSDSGWWFQMAGDTGLSAGIALESVAETALITYLTGGSGTAPQVANKLRSANSLKNLYSGIKNAKRLKNQAALFGLIRRHHEGIIEASDIFQDRYEYYTDKGYSPEEAKKNAAEGAAATYRNNLPLMVLDALTFRLMTVNPVSGKSKDIVSSLLGKIKNPLVRGGTKLTSLMAGEFAEEYWQAIASEEGKRTADVSAGIIKDDTSTFYERLKHYNSKGETWNAAISGMFGGPFLAGVGKMYNKVQERNNPYIKAHNDLVNSMSGIGLELSDRIKEADAKGDVAKSNSLRRQLGMMKAINALHLDNLTDKDTAFSSYKNYLDSVYEAASASDDEALNTLGIQDTEFILEAFPNFIKDAEKIEEIYNNVKHTAHRDAIVPIVYRSFVLNNLNEELPKTEADINTAKSTIPDYGSLTDLGRENFDLQYQLQSVQTERARIRNLKEEFGYDEEQYKDISEKLTEKERNIKQRIKEIEKSDERTDKERESDRKITAAIPLQSALSNLMDQRERLENEQEVLRNDLTLWKQEDFQKETAKTKQNNDIQSANTVKELNNIEESLDQEGTLDNDTKNTIDNKKETIVVNQVADNIKKSKKSPFGGKILNPSEDDYNSIRTSASAKLDELADQSIDKSGKDYTLVDDDNLYEPIELKDELPEETLNQIREQTGQYYNSLQEDMGTDPTFEEFVRDYIKHSSKESADTYFNALVKGWELNEYPPADYKQVYNNIFKNREEIGSSLTSAFERAVTNDKQLRNKIDETTKNTEQKESHPTTFDTNNAPVYEYRTFTTSESDPKLGFNNRLSKQIITEGEEGAIAVDYEYTEDELNEGDYTNSLKLLDPDKYLPGTKLTARVPENVNEILIPIYQSDGTKAAPMTFGDWMRENDIEEGSDEYKAKVPIILYDTDGEGVAFVHDPSWYHPLRFRETVPGQMQQAIDKTMHIRNTVVDSTSPVDMTITSKKGGTLEGLKIPKDQPLITLKEANPETRLAVTRSDGNLYEGPNNLVKDSLENTQDFNSGEIFEIRRTGVDEDGRKQYIALHVTQEQLTREASDTVMWVIKAHMNQFNKGLNQADRNIYDNIRNKITSVTGLDIYDKQDFEDYLNLFIPTIKVVNAQSERDIRDYAEANLSTGKPYIGIQGGNIVIGKKGFNMTANTPYYYIYPEMFSHGKANISLIEKVFSKLENDIVPAFSQNVSLKGLDSNRPVPLITSTGNVSVVSNEYSDYLKDTLKTNVKSHNIGTSDAPVWVTKIQPIITYNIADETHEQTQEAVAKEKTEAKKQETDKDPLSIPRSTVNDGSGKPVKVKVNRKTKEDGSEVITFTQDTTNKKGEPRQQKEKVYKNPTDINEDFDINWEDNESSLELINAVLENNPKNTLRVSKIDVVDGVHYIRASIGDNKITIIGTPKNLIKTELTTLKDKTKQVTIIQEEGLFDEEVQELIDLAEEDLKWIDRDESFYEPIDITDEQVAEILEGVARIPGIHPLHQHYLVDYVFNNISSKVSFQKGTSRNKEDILKDIKKEYDAIVGPIKSNYKERKAKLEEIYNANPEKYPNLKSVIESYDIALNKIAIIDTNFEVIQKDAMQKIRKYTGIVESQNDDIEDVESDREKNYSQTSLEENGKDTSSYRLKRFFAGVKDKRRDANGTPQDVTSFLNLPTYIGFDKVYNTLSQILAEVPSDINLMKAKLEEHQHNYAWMPSVIAKLNDADKQIQNEFVSVMNKHSLNMEFIMYSYDRKRDRYNHKIYNTNSNAVTQLIQDKWYNNFKDSELTTSSDGVYILNKKRAQYLLDTFNGWIGEEEVLPGAASRVIKDLKTKPTATQRVTVNVTNKKTLDAIGKGGIIKSGGKYYMATRKEGNKVTIGLHKRIDVTPQQLQNWLAEFGVEVSPETIGELITKGMWHNRRRVTFDNMFQTGTSNGLFGILAQKLKDYLAFDRDVEVEKEGTNPLGDSIMKSLAKVESKYTIHTITNSFRDNGKSVYGFTPSKFLTDRVRDLKTDENIANQLSNISFSKNSLWLDLIKNEDGFKEKFDVVHLGLNAIKELGKKLYRDNSLQNLSDSDHELTKLGFFQSYEQGQVVNKVNGIDMRMARMFSPTMSDKSTMTLIKTGILDLKEKHFMKNGDNVVMSPALKNTLYEQIILPEVERMVNYYKNVTSTNIVDYNPGMFYFIPLMNEMRTKEGVKLVEAIKQRPDAFDVEYVHKNMKEDIFGLLQTYVDDLVREKLTVWDNAGFIETKEIEVTEDGKNVKRNVRTPKFFDNKYLGKFRDAEYKVIHAANDYVINSLIANANSFMTLAGDPALYYKSKPETPMLQKVRETFKNIGKRLANQIAPGIKIADSDNKNSKYYQVFLQDKKSVSKNIKYLEKLLGKEGAASYRNIEGTDAQEYTTWKEHLYILEKMGRTPDIAVDITPEEIGETRRLLSSGTKLAAMTDKQKVIFKKVLQPIKPVYTGQIYDENQDVMRTMYIKSSSFPLVPQMTKGMEIDKLRKALEKLEKDTGKTVRASYQSANKVGAITNPIKLFDGDNVNSDALTNLMNSSLILERKNFRIQQDVPFKSADRKEDTISMGTQTTKLLFGNGVLDLDGFIYNGKEMTGRELFEQYNNHFKTLIDYKTQELFDELGMNRAGIPIDVRKTMAKLQSLLKTEAQKRGYPKQDIEALGVTHKTDTQGNIVDVQFNLPLWVSANSNRYEALLNSIVTNRIAKIKMPGSSFVAGSEEGFRVQDDLKGIDENRIVFTKEWTGELQPAILDSKGKLKKTQVLLPSKFRNNEGELIDLFEKRDNEYLYVEQGPYGEWLLKEDMIDSDLLSLTSFRIPTSSHVSMAQIEIVGFLPYEAGDLVILPRNLTTQKGLDFDIDKENMYHLWHMVGEDGKIQKIEKFLETDIENEFINIDGEIEDTETYLNELRGTSQELRDAINTYEEELSLPEELGIDYRDVKNKLRQLREELDKKASRELIRDTVAHMKMLRKMKEKLIHNEIIKIHESVLTNPSDEMQKKINAVLSTDYAESQADFIESLNDATKESSKLIGESTTETSFTPLSDEYQKNKVFLGASGKVGTGAYSLDVVFHSQSQQIDTPMQLMEEINLEEEIGRPAGQATTIRFGNYVSDGKLGKSKTIDGSRTITEVLAERQNIAVDNEKLQVMGRVNINSITLDVDKIITLLGFDKGEDGNSISFLFLSQPIIKDYVKEMQNISSNTAEFSKTKEHDVIEKLLKKYESSFEQLALVKKEVRDRLLTNETMINELKSAIPDNYIQGAILHKFLELKAYGEALRAVQITTNVDSKGLGKSLFDVNEKLRQIINLSATPFIDNAHKIIGDYIYISDLDQNTIANYIEEGYIHTGGSVLIKPTTIPGMFAVNALTTASNLWSKFFPYNTRTVNTVFDEILNATTDSETSDLKMIEIRQHIFKEMKKYMHSNTKLNLFSESPQVERQRLFLDTEDSQSLASYLKELKATVGNEIIDNKVKKNNLLNRFEFDINKDGTPSLIKFNNSAGENFDEEYLYNSLLELMEKKSPLPEFNGIDYDTRKLAQDLIAYSYLEGGVQEAIQFTKYVPVSYLNSIGYAEKMRGLNFDIHNIFGIKQTEEYTPSRFTMQYAQHNPNRMPKITDADLTRIVKTNKDYNKNNLNSLKEFQLEGELNPKTFLAIYNPDIRKGNKHQLYYYQGNKYVRIPVLGMFGMNEYDLKQDVYDSIINVKTNKAVSKQKTINKTEAEPQKAGQFKIEEGNIEKTIADIANTDFKENEELKTLANKLLPFIDGTVTLKVDDILNDKGDRVARGRYNKDRNEITIDRLYLSNGKPEDIAKTILHENLHAMTAKELDKYMDKQGNYHADADPPQHIIKIRRLYQEVVKNSHLSEEIKKYQEKRQQQLTGKTSESTTERERTVAYGGYNIHEFVTMVMSEPAFQRELAGMKYKNTNQSMLDKFKEFVTEMLASIGVQFDSDSIAAQAIDSVFELLETSNKKVEPSKKTTKFGNVQNLEEQDMIDMVNREIDDIDDTEKGQGDFLQPDSEEWLEEENKTDCPF